MPLFRFVAPVYRSVFKREANDLMFDMLIHPKLTHVRVFFGVSCFS